MASRWGVGFAPSPRDSCRTQQDESGSSNSPRPFSGTSCETSTHHTVKNVTFANGRKRDEKRRPLAGIEGPSEKWFIESTWSRRERGSTSSMSFRRAISHWGGRLQRVILERLRLGGFAIDSETVSSSSSRAWKSQFDRWTSLAVFLLFEGVAELFIPCS